MPEFGDQVFASGFVRGMFIAALLLAVTLALYVLRRNDDSKPIRRPTKLALTLCLAVSAGAGSWLAKPQVQEWFAQLRPGGPTGTPSKPPLPIASPPEPVAKNMLTSVKRKPFSNRKNGKRSSPSQELYSVQWVNLTGRSDDEFDRETQPTMDKCRNEADAMGPSEPGVFPTRHKADLAAAVAKRCAGMGFSWRATSYRNRSLEMSRANLQSVNAK